jgi:Ni,Fe-hydrogenase III component G
VDQSKIHDSKKTQLRNELLKELPGVKLPNSKMGLSVAISKLIEVNNLDADIDFILGSKESILSSQIGNREKLKKRAKLSPELAFRLATLAYWQYNWL